MMVIPPAIGVILILVGIILFIVDLSVTNHGLLTAGGIVTLLAGGLALLGAGVPYSGVLLGALVVVAMLMGGVLFGILGALRSSKGRPALTGKEGMIGEVGSVRSPVGVSSEGWIFVHGELWRAVLAFAPGDHNPRQRPRPRNGRHLLPGCRLQQECPRGREPRPRHEPDLPDHSTQRSWTEESR